MRSGPLSAQADKFLDFPDNSASQINLPEPRAAPQPEWVSLPRDTTPCAFLFSEQIPPVPKTFDLTYASNTSVQHREQIKILDDPSNPSMGNAFFNRNRKNAAQKLNVARCKLHFFLICPKSMPPCDPIAPNFRHHFQSIAPNSRAGLSRQSQWFFTNASPFT